jgi:alpha-tubulin suppressor-like RCC1 family protein
MTDKSDKLVHVPKQDLARIRKGGLVARGLELLQVKKTKVVCWGDTSYGQCDVPSDLGDVKDISAYSWYSMALLEDGTVQCWGQFDSTQFSVKENPFTVLLKHGAVQQITAGWDHFIALLADGTVRCWGNNDDVSSDLGKVKQIALGEEHFMALLTDGTVTVRCWGDCNCDRRDVPSDLGKVIQIAAGAYHCMALVEVSE